MNLVKDIEIIKVNNKYGLKNNIKDDMILSPIYDLIKKWEHSDSYYFSTGEHDIPDIPEMYIIMKNNKIGFANESGLVVEPTYDSISEEDFVYDEKLYPVFVAVKNGYCAYIDKYGKPLTEFIYKDVKFPIISPLAHVLNKNGIEEYISLISGKTFFSNKENKYIISTTSRTHMTMLIDGKRYKVFDKDGNIVADFLNNKELNSHPVRYLNEKLLVYLINTEISKKLYKFGLLDHSGKVLTDAKYSEVKAILGTSTVLCKNLVGELEELVDENGVVLKSKMKNVHSLNGNNIDGYIIPPLVYWKEDEDPTDINKCILVDENFL